MPDPVAVCRQVSKTYATPAGGIEALHAVDGAFAAGEVTALVGASGSGKSTLLRALGGLDRPSGGSILVGGVDIAAASPAMVRRHRRVGVTFVNQKPAENFIPHLTMQEHDPGRGARLLTEFGLGHRLDARAVELSGGEQARAAFALALARGTAMLLADEPTAELDRGSAAPLLAAIRAHAATGAAIVIATHDDDVVAIADRVLRLERGRVIGEAPAPVSPRRAATSAGGEIVVSARGLVKTYRRGSERIDALTDGSLDLARDELAVLLGRSGSGKSTLLAILAGLQRPDRGDIVRSVDERRWGELAFLPQRFGLLPELSIRENVEYPPRLAGSLDRDRLEVDRLLERLGLSELQTRPPSDTSIGQQQRTALARALVLKPTVLLADEPASHQDAGWRDRVWQLLVESAEAGTACLVATHEERTVAYASRVWQIDSGASAPRAGSAGRSSPPLS